MNDNRLPSDGRIVVFEVSEVQSQAIHTLDPDAFVFFGTTGDLARKKIFSGAAR